MTEIKRTEKELKERGERLRMLFKYYNIKSQEDLALKVGCTQSMIGRLLSGSKTCATSKFVYPISKVLPCSYEWLEYGIGNGPAEKESENAIGKLISQLIPNFQSVKIVPVLSYAMSDPANPSESIEPGKIIIVDPTLTPSHGKIVLAIKKGTRETLLRRYIEEDGHKLLIASNPTFKPIDIKDIEKIEGIVIWHGYNLIDKTPELEK